MKKITSHFLVISFIAIPVIVFAQKRNPSSVVDITNRQGKARIFDTSPTFCNDTDTHNITLDEAARLIYNFQVLYRPISYNISAGGVLDFSTPKRLRILDYTALLLHMCYDTVQKRFFVAADWTQCVDTNGRLEASDDIKSDSLLVSDMDIPFFDTSILQNAAYVKNALGIYSTNVNKSKFLSKAEVDTFRTRFKEVELGNYPAKGAFFKKDTSIGQIMQISKNSKIRYYWGYDPEGEYKLRLILIGVDNNGKNIFTDQLVKESSRPKPHKPK